MRVCNRKMFDYSAMKGAGPPLGWSQKNDWDCHMTGGSKIVGIRPEHNVDGKPKKGAEAAPLDVPMYEADAEEEVESASSIWPRVVLSLVILAAFGWIAAASFAFIENLGGLAPTLLAITSFIASLSAPLALLGVAVILALRSSRSEARRFAATIERLRDEEARLATSLADMARRIDANRVALAEQGSILVSLGEDTATRLSDATEAMRGQLDTITRHSATLKNSASGARADMAVLLSDLPRAQVEARRMTEALESAGQTALEKTNELDSQLALLTARGREADDIATGAAQKLAERVAHLHDVSIVAADHMEKASANMTQTLDVSLERAADALATAQKGLEAHGEAMMAVIEQGHAAIAAAGAQSTEAVATRVAAIGARVDEVARVFESQEASSQALVDRINADISAIEGRFSNLGDDTVADAERASAAILGLRDHADQLGQTLDAGGASAAGLIRQAEALLVALDASAREIDETLPAAYQRLQDTAEASKAAARAVMPEVEAIETASGAALARLQEAEALVAKQREDVRHFVETTGATLSDSRATAEALNREIESAQTQALALTGTTAPQLIDALMRIKDAANQATEHARNALANVVPEAASSLGVQARAAMTAALTAQVEEQMADIARKAEEAVAAAHKATDRLMRQMLTISETSAGLEARVDEAKDEIVRGDGALFARRMALILESLNSTAIDVTKILSNDVTDTAWASYLRGDRGVFTRRAVRLLDAGEAREILLHYEDDSDFRDHVNRYIHDFEAMLRNVLATRDGMPLSVTLLSSDAGKLYVALAQAIERLRR